MLNDPLANALSKIKNAENLGKNECTISPCGKLIENVLKIMQDHHYVGEQTEVSEARGRVVNLPLLGNINKCGAIKPRFTVKLDEYEKYEKRYLPAKNMGIMIISTSKGLMIHTEAKKKKLEAS